MPECSTNKPRKSSQERNKEYYWKNRDALRAKNKAIRLEAQALTCCVLCNKNPPRKNLQTCLECRSKCQECGAPKNLRGRSYNCRPCQKAISATVHKVARKLRREGRLREGLCQHCGRNKVKPNAKYCAECGSTVLKQYRVTKLARTRERIFSHYGRACACCGEDNPYFLSVDHINNDGNIQRMQSGTHRSGFTATIGVVFRTGNWPDDLQILCYNCNMSKGHFGACGHELVRLQNNGSRRLDG